MIQMTAMNSAKPASTGADILAAMGGESPDFQGFEDALSSEMNKAPAARGGEASSLTNDKAEKTGKTGKATGKANGKILPQALPDGAKLPEGKAKAASLTSDDASDADLPVEGTANPTVATTEADNVTPVLPLPVLALQTAETAVSEDGDAMPGSKGTAHESEKPAPAGAQVQLPTKARGDENAAVAKFVSMLPTDSKQVPGQSAGATIQLPPSAQSLPIQASAASDASPKAQAIPVQAIALEAVAMPGNAVRLQPVLAKGGEAGTKTVADMSAPVAAPAEEGAPLIPSPEEEAAPTTISTSRSAHLGTLSAKERPEAALQHSRGLENRQDAVSWFNGSTQTQANAAAPSAQITPTHGLERPQDFAALVDRLVAAREFATPAPVQTAINHAEFGKITLKFEQGDQGLSVAVSSRDPEFARAVQAAAPTDSSNTNQNQRDGSSSGNSAAFRQDAQAQSSAGGNQAQSRNAGGNDRQSNEFGQLRRNDPAPDHAEAGKPRRSGIFA